MAKSIATILDITSSKITALIGEKGVNNTFVFKSIKTLNYSGYESSSFFDLQELNDVINSAIKSIEISGSIKIKKIYVSVPGEFMLVQNGINSISLTSNKRINERDILKLTSSIVPLDGYLHIKSTPIFYNLSDKIRTINPIGYRSTMLEGFFSHFYCKKEFIETIDNIINANNIYKINYIPSSLAQSLYLIPSEIRDEKAYLLNIGYLSSTISIVCGNGVIAQKSFSRGDGYITAYLSQSFEVDFELAQLIEEKANLSVNYLPNTDIEIIYKDKPYLFNLKKINEIIYFAIDEICELIALSFESFNDEDINGKPILVTGGGLYNLRGAYDYISKRLNIVIENIFPKQPYFNKPQQSTILSLLSYALEDDNKKSSFYNKLFN